MRCILPRQWISNRLGVRNELFCASLGPTCCNSSIRGPYRAASTPGISVHRMEDGLYEEPRLTLLATHQYNNLLLPLIGNNSRPGNILSPTISSNICPWTLYGLGSDEVPYRVSGNLNSLRSPRIAMRWQEIDNEHGLEPFECFRCQFPTLMR
jgi:hypothetical protein